MEVTAAAVTGGARGIGKACTESLLQNNCKVAFCDVNLGEGEKAQTELRGKYGDENVFFLPCDVSDLQELEGFFCKAKEILGGLNLIINNAGIVDFPRSGRCSQIVDVNLKGTLKGMEMGVKLMGKDRGGSGGVVVSISSTGAYDPTSLFPAYDASKAGIMQATRSYTTEVWEPRGVKFMCIFPGSTVSLIFNITLADLTVPESDYFSKYLQRYGMQQPEEVGAALIEILKKGINGSHWLVDNGKIEPLGTSECYIKSKL